MNQIFPQTESDPAEIGPSELKSLFSHKGNRKQHILFEFTAYRVCEGVYV